MSHESVRPAYAVGQFRDAGAEMERLRQQAAMVSAAEDTALDALGFPPRGRVVDVGCGPGFVAARLRRHRPELEVVGVDRDHRVLAEAAKHVAVVCADATSIPLETGSFDAAHARVVLRHLGDPAACVREMARLVRPGGRVFLAASDDGTLAVDPMPVGFERILEARHASFRRRGAEPCMGRRLPTLLHEAGLRELRTEALLVSSDVIGPRAFAAIVLAPLSDAIDDDLADPAEVEATARAIRTWGELPSSFGALTAVFASGEKVG